MIGNGYDAITKCVCTISENKEEGTKINKTGEREKRLQEAIKNASLRKCTLLIFSTNTEEDAAKRHDERIENMMEARKTQSIVGVSRKYTRESLATSRERAERTSARVLYVAYTLHRIYIRFAPVRSCTNHRVPYYHKFQPVLASRCHYNYT